MTTMEGEVWKPSTWAPEDNIDLLSQLQLF